MREEQSLFRMNFIIQDNNASTIDTNLVKIIETIIYESANAPLNYIELEKRIREDYELHFAEEEIKKAIERKGKNLEKIQEGYILKPKYKQKLDCKINRLVKQMIVDLSLDTSEKELKELIERYLYYSFNQNKESVLALLNGEQIEIQKFTQSEDEIKLINCYKRKQQQAVSFRSQDSIDYLCQCMSMLVMMRQ
ncbi:MAG: hypothetical protein ACRC7V_04840, partial [Lachnospiraceae bacterium]